MSSMREGVQRAEDAEAALKDPQRRVPRAVRRLPESVPNQVAVEAAPNGPRWRAALPLPRVLFHLQDQATTQRAQEKAFGKQSIRNVSCQLACCSLLCQPNEACEEAHQHQQDFLTNDMPDQVRADLLCSQ